LSQWKFIKNYNQIICMILLPVKVGNESINPKIMLEKISKITNLVVNIKCIKNTLIKLFVCNLLNVK